MYASQIAEIKAQEAKLFALAAKPESDFSPAFVFDEEEGKSNEQIKAEAVAAEKEHLNRLLRNLGELVAFGEPNNQGI